MHGDNAIGRRGRGVGTNDTKWRRANAAGRKERLDIRTKDAGFQGAFRSWLEVFSRAPVSVALSTWFGVGFLPGPTGTWGSLATIPFVEAIHILAGVAGLPRGGALALLWGFAVLSAVLGIPASGRTARLRGVSDPSEIVIDEVAGQSLALASLYTFLSHESPLFWGAVGFAFFSFRVLDVVKPGPIGWLERLAGGYGVVLDDVASGAVLALLFAVLGAFGLLGFGWPA